MSLLPHPTHSLPQNPAETSLFFFLPQEKKIKQLQIFFSLFSVNSIVDAACLDGNPSLPPTPPMALARTNFPATFPTKPNFPLTIPAKIQRALTTSGHHRLMEFF
ncbi:hypothetical protein AMTRI_Chr12g238200 [Amborella trichopoda]